VSLSTGQITSPKGLGAKEAGRLLRLQRRLARATRGSNRRKKARTLIAGFKARDGDRRKDWLEKTSTGLARRFDVIRVENLNIKAMTRSARGTVQNPGRHPMGLDVKLRLVERAGSRLWPRRSWCGF
jgi:putative transposase